MVLFGLVLFLGLCFMEVSGAVEGEGAGGGIIRRGGGALAAISFAFHRLDRLRFAAARAGIVEVERGVFVTAGELCLGEEEDVIAGFGGVEKSGFFGRSARRD
jgi:hypothetical protein